jgi:DNA-cytosine methyltransferase
MLKLFSSFAGYGTDNFALKQLGVDFECVGFSEIDKYAIQCFEQNHKGKNFGDITKINWDDVQDFDLLTGGFPCQDVSVAGHQDLNRGRSILGFELTKALKIKQPKYFLFENVKGILCKKFDEFRNELLKQWSEAGYNIYYKCLNTKDYGIPQNRERVFFVGFRKDIDKGTFQFPEKEELKIFIKDILEPEPVGEKYYLKEHQIEKLEKALIEKLNRKMVSDTIHNGGRGSLRKKYNHDLVSVRWDNKNGENSQGDRSYDIVGVSPTICKEVKIHSIQPRSEDRPSFVKAREEGKSYPGGFGHLSKEDGTTYCLDTSNTQCIELINPYNLKISGKESGTIGQSVGTTTGKTAQIVSNCLTEAIGRQGSSKEFLNSCEKVSNSINLKEGEQKFIDVYNKKLQDNSPTLSNPNHNSLRLYNNGIFRRLTPKEFFRLQGFLNDEVNLDGLSDTQCYKLAGNGQSVNVVKLIFSEMFK